MRWAPLDGWKPDPDLPSWLSRPDHPRWLRSQDGRWWSRGDVLEGRVEMTDDGPRLMPGWFLDPQGRWVREPREPAERKEIIAELRQKLGGVA
jgi:hypothetical protein